MTFRPEEVSTIIQQELKGYTSNLEMESRGSVLQVGDGIARVWGLEDAMAGELLEFTGGVMGMVLNLEEDNVGVVLFGTDTGIKEGDSVRRTGNDDPLYFFPWANLHDQRHGRLGACTSGSVPHPGSGHS